MSKRMISVRIEEDGKVIRISDNKELWQADLHENLTPWEVARLEIFRLNHSGGGDPLIVVNDRPQVLDDLLGWRKERCSECRGTTAHKMDCSQNRGIKGK